MNKLQIKLEAYNIYISLDDYETAQECIEAIEEENMFDEDVIYYSNAIDYLKEYDPSLNESLEIANEYGYQLQNINSELLASLLKSQNNREDFYNDKVSYEIEEYYKSK